VTSTPSRRGLGFVLGASITVASGCATIERHSARAEVEAIADQVYFGGSDNPKHRLDLFFPRNRPGFPVAVFIHGGYWRAGDRNYYSSLTGLYGSIGLSLAKRGIGVAVMSYRLAPEVTIERELEDVARAVRFTLDASRLHGGDATRIVLTGHSAGGHLAMLLAFDDRWLRAAGVDPSLVAGVVALSPVVDIADMHDRNDAAFNADITDRVFGLDRSRFAPFSPKTHIHAGEAPALLLLGGHDYPYLVAQVRLAVEQIHELAAPVELEEIPGYTHEDMVRKVGDRDDAITPRVAAFIERVEGTRQVGTP